MGSIVRQSEESDKSFADVVGMCIYIYMYIYIYIYIYIHIYIYIYI
jgi:hypothetical protein